MVKSYNLSAHKFQPLRQSVFWFNCFYISILVRSGERPTLSVAINIACPQGLHVSKKKRREVR